MCNPMNLIKWKELLICKQQLHPKWTRPQLYNIQDVQTVQDTREATECRLCKHGSLVPRPRPAFCHLQYGKLQATESWVGPGNEAINMVLLAEYSVHVTYRVFNFFPHFFLFPLGA